MNTWPWHEESVTDALIVAELSALSQIVSFFIIGGLLYNRTALYDLRAVLNYEFRESNYMANWYYSQLK